VTRTLHAAMAATLALMATTAITDTAMAFGEAGPLTLREMGNFTVGGTVSEPNEKGGVTISGQSYVGFALPAEQSSEVPLVLIHGGGGQSSDWFSTVDGRDGWRNYFVNAGIDTYWIDRPGLGRSPSNPAFGPDDAKGMVGQADSTLIAGLASSVHWPDAVVPEGEWSREAWTAANATNPGVVSWLSLSTAGPYGGNELARQNIVALADRIGPVVLFGHSAGVASTVQAGLTAPEGKVKGLLIFEGGVDILSEANRGLGTWEPALPADFAPVDVGGGCMMQPEGAVSKNLSLANVPVIIIRSEHGNGTDEAYTCSVNQLKQAGVDARFIRLVDNGFEGNGHFMMSETNSGEIATDLLVPIIKTLQGQEELPADWTVIE